MTRLPALRSIFGALALFLGSPALPHSVEAQPKIVVLGGNAGEAIISADGTVRHKAANFIFPQQIGDMPLRKVVIYGPADLSVDYSLRGGGNGDVWITFFVYPVGHPMTDEIADIERAFIDKVSGTHMEAPAPSPEMAADGHTRWFKGHLEGMAMTTGYTLVQRAGWFLEARFSIPDAAGQQGIERTVRALAGVPWDWNSSPAKTATPNPI